VPAPLVVRRAAAAAGLVAAGWLVGCSAETELPIGTVDGVPGGERAERTRLVAGLAELYAGPGATAAQEATASCFARRFVTATTTEELVGAGLVVDGDVADRAPALPRATAERWFAAQQACAPYVEASTRAQVAATKGRLDAQAYAACLRRSLPPARIEAAVVATLTASWDDPAVAELTQAQVDCAAAALPRD
jgi:hypothetical protein